jgi:hypothetical protein
MHRIAGPPLENALLPSATIQGYHEDAAQGYNSRGAENDKNVTCQETQCRKRKIESFDEMDSNPA